MEPKKPGPELFAAVLKLIQLKLKQLETMMELVRSLSMEELKKAKAPNDPTIYEVNTELGKHVPWVMPRVDLGNRYRSSNAWWLGLHRKEIEVQNLIGKVKCLRAEFDLIKMEDPSVNQNVQEASG